MYIRKHALVVERRNRYRNTTYVNTGRMKRITSPNVMSVDLHNRVHIEKG